MNSCLETLCLLITDLFSPMPRQGVSCWFLSSDILSTDHGFASSDASTGSKSLISVFVHSVH